MMQVSDKAMTLLKETLDGTDRAPDQVFRLVEEQDHIALRVASSEAGDVIFETEGTAVLAAPEAIATRLDNRTIDVDDTSGEPKLFVK